MGAVRTEPAVFFSFFLCGPDRTSSVRTEFASALSSAMFMVCSSCCSRCSASLPLHHSLFTNPTTLPTYFSIFFSNRTLSFATVLALSPPPSTTLPSETEILTPFWTRMSMRCGSLRTMTEAWRELEDRTVLAEEDVLGLALLHNVEGLTSPPKRAIRDSREQDCSFGTVKKDDWLNGLLLWMVVLVSSWIWASGGGRVRSLAMDIAIGLVEMRMTARLRRE